MDAGLAWTVIGSVAGVAALAVGVLQLRQARGDGGRDLPGGGGVLLPPGGRLPVRVRGRDELAGELAKLARVPDGRVHVLAGLGGSGKSTVALTLAQEVLRQAERRTAFRRRAMRVWWVPAADPASLTGALLGLAGKLGAAEGEVREALAGRLNPSDVLWPRLEAAGGWVLVLDNADDAAALTVGDRAAGEGAGWLRATRAGLVLVTSRISARQAWGPVSVIHAVGSLDDDDGALVLTDLAPGAGGTMEAAKLSARLGGLPLALYQAGSYLRSPFAAERTFTAYLDALAAQFGELLGRGDEDRARVTATWELSLTALAGQGRGQVRLLLRVLACFAAAVPVPPLILDIEMLGPSCGGVVAVEQGLSGLLDAGLIQAQALSPASGRPPVLIHPLVAETIRRRAAGQLGEAAAVAAALLEAAAGHLDEEDPRDLAGWGAVLPHLQAVLSLSAALPREALAELAGTAAGVSAALVWGGSYLASLEVAEVALEHAALLGHEHAQILALRYWRASARRLLGQYAAAETELRQVLDARLRVLGPEHPSTLATRYEIGRLLADQGKLTAAGGEFRQVLDAGLPVLGADHRTILAVRQDSARVLADQGKPAAAEAEFRQVLDARLRVLGPEHPSTMSTRHSIAAVLADQGKPGAAEAEFRQVLDARLQVLGPEHPSTLAARHEIGCVLADQGKPAAAEAEFRQVLDARLRVLGADHRSTLSTRYQIARVLAAQGKLATAEAEFRQVLDARLRVLGADHPDTLTTAESIKHLHSENHG